MIERYVSRDHVICHYPLAASTFTLFCILTESRPTLKNNDEKKMAGKFDKHEATFYYICKNLVTASSTSIEQFGGYVKIIIPLAYYSFN